MMFTRLLRALGLAAALLASSEFSAAAASLTSAKGGSVRAFLVGINKYTYVNPLYGSVADVRDIETALKGAGVPPENIQVLTDAAATRPNFVAQMERLLAESKAGDLVIMSFSGHGMRVPELPQWKGRDPLGLSEEFVLVGYQATGAGTREGVMNKEIKAWLSRFDAKGVDVIFIADTCHGGGLARSVAQEAPDLTIRLIKESPKAGENQFTPINVTPRELAVDVQDLSHITFMAGADREHVVPEFPIPGQATRRGALSFAFARAIEGNARDGGSTVTTRGQLFGYALQMVAQISNSQQIMDFLPLPNRPALLEAPLLRQGGDAPLPAAAPDAIKPPSRPTADSIGLFVMNGDAGLVKNVQSTAAFAVVPGKADAALIWDAAARKVISVTGDIIVQDIGADSLGGVIDRTFAIHEIEKMSQLHPQSIRLKAGGKRYTPNDRPEIQASGLKGQHLVVFNLAGNGEVQMLSPAKGGLDQVAEDQWTYVPTVNEPYGEDRVIAISSTEAMPDLRDWLWLKNGKLAASLVPQKLAETLSGKPSVRVGTVGLFTSR